jgi:ketosteroid isomerase-like protein
MTPTENKLLLEAIFAALATGDSRPFVAAMADDVTWTVMGRTPWSKTYEGKAAVLGLLRELGSRLADRYRATASLILADGDHVVVTARGQATTRSGAPYDNDYCFIYRLERGAIREVTEYLDTELVSSALG